MEKAYIAIDLKSFYASAECVLMGLDPLDTNLVVADESRTDKTICLAVTPSLKAVGVPSRPRLFEVRQQVQKVNRQRVMRAPYQKFEGESCIASELAKNKALELGFHIAVPRMAHYMKVSTQVYNIYLRYIAPEDIHVYSIDEVFIDATNYLETYRMTARELAMRMIQDVLAETKITATAGIGTNLYLCKIAMDIVAKKMPPDKDGVRIAELNELSYRQQLWEHRPLTDFWRVGRGIARKLESHGICTMGDIAEISVQNEELLYRLFGVNAQLLIDHAWGWEPCTIADIKAYRPAVHSISQGQVLSEPYSYEKGRLIVREMTDLLVLDLVEKEMMTDQMVLTVGYDHLGIPETYDGQWETDYYGRRIPKSAHGSVNLGEATSSTKKIVSAVMRLYRQIVDSRLMVRRMYVVANHVVYECECTQDSCVQLDLFTDYEAEAFQFKRQEEAVKREKSLQKAILRMQSRFGKNAVIKGMNLQEGAKTIERNGQVGGHRA